MAKSETELLLDLVSALVLESNDRGQERKIEEPDNPSEPTDDEDDDTEEWDRDDDEQDDEESSNGESK
jgi:hypothetical protein